MRYMLLIYASEADYSHMTSEEHAAIMQGHGTFAANEHSQDYSSA